MKKKRIMGAAAGILLLGGCGIAAFFLTERTSETDVENTVVWAVSSDVKVSDKTVDAFNVFLKQNGYDMTVRFQTLPTDGDGKDPGIYHDALKEAVRAGEVDIAYCDLAYDTAPGEMQQFLRSGIFEDLTQWLHSGEGEAVYDLYDAQVWEGCLVDGKQYILPDENSMSQPELVVSFLQGKVSGTLADSWDGSWEDLLRILGKISLAKSDRMMVGSPWLEFFEGAPAAKRYMTDTGTGLIYDIKKGKVWEPFSLTEFHEYLSFLHQCFQKGYLTKENQMNSGNLTQEESACLQEGNYAVLLECDAEESRKVWSRKASFAVTGVLGGGIAVSANSDNKDAALSLLKLLRTNDEAANTLVWGDLSARERQGQAPTQKEALGLHDGITQESGQTGTDIRMSRKKFMESSLRTSSCLLGFWPDYDVVEDDLQRYQTALAQVMDCWQEDDFETSYRKARRKMEAVSGALVRKINSQIRQWKGKEEKKK